MDKAVKELAQAATDLATQRCMSVALPHVYEVLAARVETVEALRLLFLRIVALSLIEGVPFPTGCYWILLIGKIELWRAELTGLDKYPESRPEDESAQATGIFRAFSEHPGGRIENAPEDVFARLLGDAFNLRISTAEAMISPAILQIQPYHGRGKGGLQIRLRIDESQPSICALADGDFEAAHMEFRLSNRALVCPVSLFERYGLRSVEIEVGVEGLKTLAAFSDDALVATDQTFTPFGAAPADGASFVIGSPELAQKAVTQVGVSLSWTDIPDQPGGFAAHYEGYGRKLDIPEPKIALDYLSGNGWKTVIDTPKPMFATDPITRKLMPDWSISGSVQGHSVSAEGVVRQVEFSSRQSVRAGLARLRLSGTASGFHASQYPLALVQAMRPRLMRFGKRKIPPRPFLPTIASIALNYRAETSIELDAPGAASHAEKIVQCGPFGQIEVYPKRTLRQTGLFPKRLGYGELYLQLDGPTVTGPMALAFVMEESGHLRSVPDPNLIKWYYLTQTGWAELPETAISSDTTLGLMRSGLVMIDLPEEALDHSTEMPEGGVWIAAVATKPRLDGFPKLHHVSVNGVWLRSVDHSYHNGHKGERVWTFTPPQPGTGEITEIATHASITPPETEQAYITRVGERLNHRGRAVTPWDVERLILERFPEVWMAKCLPVLNAESPVPNPGQATIVVVRGPSLSEHPQPVLFDVTTLKRIKDFVSGLASGFAQFEVVNAAFEQLQVRAKLEFEPEREGGAMAQKLKAELARVLSVWTAAPNLRRFGWSLNVKTLQAHVNALPYVHNITDFSVLQLAGDQNEGFALLDTAQSDARGRQGPVLRASRPWSLPISAADHGLTISHALEREDAVQSGIGRLPVGEMLIVAQRTKP